MASDVVGLAFDGEAFKKSLKYERTATADQIRQDMAAIALIDAASEGRQKQYGTRVAFSVFGLVLSVVATFFAFSMGGGIAGGLMVCVLIATLVALIYNGIKLAAAGRTNVEDRRHEVSAGLVKFLSADMPSIATFDISVDFGAYLQAGYLRDTQGSGVFGSTTVKTYAVPWLSLRGGFVDGSKFRLAATLHVKRKEKRKRKRTKVRETISEDVQLTVQVKPNRYEHLEQIADRIKQFPNRSVYTPIQVKVDGQQVRISGLAAPGPAEPGAGEPPAGNLPGAPEPPLGSHHSMLHLFMACYQGLANCAVKR